MAFTLDVTHGMTAPFEQGRNYLGALGRCVCGRDGYGVGMRIEQDTGATCTSASVPLFPTLLAHLRLPATPSLLQQMPLPRPSHTSVLLAIRSSVRSGLGPCGPGCAAPDTPLFPCMLGFSTPHMAAGRVSRLFTLRVPQPEAFLPLPSTLPLSLPLFHPISVNDVTTESLLLPS